MLRTSVPPESIIGSVVAAAAKVDPAIPLEFTTLERQVDDAMIRERLLAMLSAFFGGVALLLAMVGLYGTVSYRVTLRNMEFGIRSALGAPMRAILALVMRDVAAVVLIGIVAGIGLSLIATNAIGALLFGVGPRDIVTIAGASLLLAAVAGLAAYTPARRAARVDPAIALRAD
jgi:ABC-type antimicrobial peptide transport system permease subunit